MNVLVAGGGGYIGSHMCKYLADAGHRAVVCDNFITGHREAVQWGDAYECSIGDADRLDRLFDMYRFDAVMHFAASSIVPDSVRDPLGYYMNNVGHTITLMKALQRHSIRKIVFSSTAAVFGNPAVDFIDEEQAKEPVNPYGDSKLMMERVIADCAGAYGLAAVCLRYFNAAGADESRRIGESHQPETHLIPKLLIKAAGGEIDVAIYGDDYATPDGTCIRDFVHVTDLCDAHLRALDFLDGSPGFHTFNLGNGSGHSVRQIVAAVQDVSGNPMPLDVVPRRQGDPPRLVASIDKARRLLGWVPMRTDIRSIIDSAWQWHRNPAF